MGICLSFINQKGGAGKTTSAVNVSAALAAKGYGVLLIDLDPQGNATSASGLSPDTVMGLKTAYEVLKGEADVNDAIVRNEDGYDVLPTDIRQSGADIELSAVTGRDFLLKEYIGEIEKDYDFVVLDCPPSLSIITIMALTASDQAIIPVQGQYYALQGTAQLMKTFEMIKKRTNPELQLCGVVVTMYDGRKNLDKDVLESVKDAFGDKVFDTLIRNNVSLAEAPAFGKNIFSYKADSTGAADYLELTEEIVRRLEDE